MPEKLRTVLGINLLAGLVFTVLAALIFAFASPPKVEAAVCPTFLDVKNRAASDTAVNRNKVRELDWVSKVCNPIPLDPARALCKFIASLFRQYNPLNKVGDLLLQDSKMPAYLRYANELALSGDQDTLLGNKPPEPGAITGAIAKGLMPGYTQAGLDPIKELTESEDQLVKGTVTLNRSAKQERFTELPTYEEPRTTADDGWYDLEIADNANYEVKGRFGEVSPLYDRFGLLKQIFFPPAGRVKIPTEVCKDTDYDPSIIAIEPTTGFLDANPNRDADWTAYLPVTDPAEVTVECPLITLTYNCKVAVDGYCRKRPGTCNSDPCNEYSPAECPSHTYSCGASTLNCKVAVDGYCRVQPSCPANDSCNKYSPAACPSRTYSCDGGYNCPGELAPESFELGGNLDVQTKVAYADKAWERIGAPSYAPGEGGVFNVLLPPGSSFRTEEAEPLLDFDYDPYSMGQYRDGSTLYIAELGNVGGATSCIVDGLTAHPYAADTGACRAALVSLTGKFTGGWPTEHGCITQGPGLHSGVPNTEAIDIASNGGIGWYADGQPAFVVNDAAVKGTCNNAGGCGYPWRGKWVAVEAGGVEVHFWHLAQTLVGPGQSLSQGTPVGLIDNTGNSTGPHLHYEFRGAVMGPPNIPASPAVGFCW